ncbi:MAG: DUF5916 domain-containing protein [Bacteroidales bacterium]
MKGLKTILILKLTFLLSISIFAQDKTYKSSGIGENEATPIIDGILDDPAWEKIQWSNDFLQREPYEGRKASQETSFKILHDNDFLYIAIRAYDNNPDSIVARLSRRDNSEGDNVGIQIDSYNDKRTAFVFSVSAAGVKSDRIISDDGNNSDNNWDPIWYVNTNIDSLGWTAEMKIPFTQVRFSKKGQQKWGLQITRNIYRYDEEVHWKLIPKDAGGWVSKFGTLNGMNNIEPQKEKSLTPYTVAKLERFQKETDNPFRSSGQSKNINAGLNGKFGLTNNLTLDMAINPDFGQVEADPSEVNLTAYETFFNEKRPFFIEGSNIMNFRLMSFGDFMNDNLFYSRRIGRSPSYYPETTDNEYIKKPDNTTILGALKLTGKTKNGWSVGILESMTQKEKAEISDGDNTRYATVEPLSNYFLGRVEKDFNEGNTLFGGIFTSTTRKIDSDNLNFMHDHAYTGGVNFQHQWKDKTYLVGGRAIMSHVRGDENAIINTQRSSARYYQRPDASHLSVDSAKNALTGHAGSLMFLKLGSGNFQYGVFLNWKSPGLELNDMGYQQDADQLSQLSFASYRTLEPFSIFRRFNINVNQWQIWDYAGTSLVTGGNFQMHMNFKNYWEFGYGINGNSASLNKTALRGGPYLKEPASINYWWYVNTDHRKDFRLGFGNSQNWSKYNHSHSNSIWTEISYRPHNTVDIALNPSVDFSKNNLQYVSTADQHGENKYLMASIDRTTLRMSLRIDLSLTSELSLQYWGQPFIATGDYSNFKQITKSTAENYNDRFADFTDEQINYIEEDQLYEFDMNSDGTADHSISHPNFKVFQFKSNLVARWEYIPGSTLYLVWSQNKDDYISDGPFQFNQDMKHLNNLFPHNVFLIKLTYRLGM